MCIFALSNSTGGNEISHAIRLSDNTSFEARLPFNQGSREMARAGPYPQFVFQSVNH